MVFEGCRDSSVVYSKKAVMLILRGKVHKSVVHQQSHRLKTETAAIIEARQQQLARGSVARQGGAATLRITAQHSGQCTTHLHQGRPHSRMMASL